ncbi:hypothetical protein ABPG77_000366 [Micractinium sp. CCAP 211/92]
MAQGRILTGAGAYFLDPLWVPGTSAGTRRRVAGAPDLGATAGGQAGTAAADAALSGGGREAFEQVEGEQERGPRRTRDPYVLGPAGWTRSIPCDFIERSKEYVVRADIPGVRKAEIHVDVHPPDTPGGGPVLRFGHNPYAEREKEDAEEPGIFHRAERVTTFRNRNLRLPEDADGERISKASYEDGVLTVIIPKKELGRAPGRLLQIE